MCVRARKRERRETREGVRVRGREKRDKRGCAREKESEERAADRGWQGKGETSAVARASAVGCAMWYHTAALESLSQ